MGQWSRRGLSLACFAFNFRIRMVELAVGKESAPAAADPERPVVEERSQGISIGGLSRIRNSAEKFDLTYKPRDNEIP